MSAAVLLPSHREVIYPESDGKPMADNTRQFRIITTIKDNLDALYLLEPEVFVAGDLLWYPVEGAPHICQAPDVFVARRPKGERGSYKQWEEAGVAPHAVFEIWSPSNTPLDLLRKHDFYERHGVDEFYWHDPDRGDLAGYRLRDGRFEQIAAMNGWVSPSLGIRFDLKEGELLLFHPDGTPFRSFIELQELVQATSRRAEQERLRAEQERLRAEQEKARADAAEEELRRLRASSDDSRA